MEEAEESLEPEEDRLKNVTGPPDGAVVKVSTEIRNGDGNLMEEVRHYGDENSMSEELKAVAEAKCLGDVKNGEDEKNLNELKVGEEKNGVQQINDGEEDENIRETDIVVENEARKDVVGDGKVAGDSSQDLQEKKDFEISIGEEKMMEVDVQNGTEMKFMVERVEDEAVEEDVKYSNEKYGHGDVEAIGGKSKEEGSSAVDDISVKELENGEDEGGVEGMKVDENSKPTSSEKVEDTVLIQVEENDGEKVRKDAKDMEMVEAKDVVEEEALEAKDEERLAVRKREEDEKDNGGITDKMVSDNEKVESLKRRSRDHRSSETDEAKKDGDTEENVEEMEVNGSRKRSKEVLSSPVVSSSERPVRERKTVERLVEVIEKGPDSTVFIEKGRGTPLREIPNVAYKLARKKPVELKFLHQTLFGRKGKAVDFKSNLLRFSGFAWHESEEKQRAKIKEKLDKSVKENLLELCDLFDLSVSKTNARKDEIIMKVLDFLEAPQTMSDVMHAEKQSSKSRKRERAPKSDASKSSGNNFKKRSRQRHEKTEDTRSSDVKSSHNGKDDEEDEDTEEDNDEDKDSEKPLKKDEESYAEEKESEETGGERGDETKFDGDFKKEKQLKKSPKLKEKLDVKNSPPKQASSDSVKRKIGSDSKNSSTKIDGKNSSNTPPSKNQKSKKIDDTGENALSKKKDAESPNKSNSKSNSKENSSGKASKGKAKSGRGQESGPTKVELRNSICKILKEVDFNTATFTDLLNQLASEYKIDLTRRKSAIKLMIQEELTKLADEMEENQEED